jgi:hypothetical protein
MPLSVMALLSSAQLPNTTMSVLEWIKQKNIYTQEAGRALTIRGVRGLDTAGDSGNGRMIAYRKDPELPVWQTAPIVYFRLSKSSTYSTVLSTSLIPVSLFDLESRFFVACVWDDRDYALRHPLRAAVPAVACPVVACGRTRWKIENEGFNVMKNHGYAFEHNFGHRHRFLAMMLASLNLLAFAWHTATRIDRAALDRRARGRRKANQLLRSSRHPHRLRNLSLLARLPRSPRNVHHPARTAENPKNRMTPPQRPTFRIADFLRLFSSEAYIR